MTNDQEKFRRTAISGVERARELLDELDTHIREDHGQKVVHSKINDIRHELRVIFDAATRDGRMAGWFPGGGMGRMVFPQARKEDE